MKSESKIKTYHIIILSLFLSSLLILNSDNVNKQRAQKKINEDKNKIFDKIISKRNLQEPEESEEQTGTDKVCARGSKELIKYYQTGDMSLIGLKEDEGIQYDKNSKYMEALKLILKNILEEDDEDEENGGNEAGGNGRRRLGMSFEGETKDAVVDYGMHLLPIIIFFIVGLLAIPAWPICCFCCCCNCCCCCCCKKPGCKIPCFIFTYVFYALSVAICIYGLSATNKVFVGVADTECSMLKFFDEVLDGEIKDPPKWAGIPGIQVMLNNIHDSLIEIKENSLSELDSEIDSLSDDNDNTTPKNIFLQALEDSYKTFFNGPDFTLYKDEYIYTKDDRDYVLDIIKAYGKFTKSTKVGEPENSLMRMWAEEFRVVSEESESELQDAKSSFHDICDESFDKVTDILEKGQTKLGEFQDKFNDIKKGFPEKISDSSDVIDEYGKLSSKAIFGVLGLMNIALAVLMLLIFLCSGKMCKNCCCCRCFCKFFTHLLWNILYLLMILTFFIGFIFSLIGQLGSDFMNILSYILSEDNLGENGDNFLSGKLGKYKKYINTCVNGNGDIQNLVNIDRKVLDAFDDLYSAEDLINGYYSQFEHIPKVAYKYAMDKIVDMRKFDEAEDDFGYIYNSGSVLDKLYFKENLESINNDIGHRQWFTACNLDTCSGPQECYNPLKCDIGGKVGTDNAKIVKKLITVVKEATEASPSAVDLYKRKITDLGGKYDNFLSEYMDVLNTARGIISSITSILRQYIGEDGGFFSIVNCKFIGKHLKVLLDNLKSSLGGSVKTVGICLSVVGCSLALSISSTILLIIIINVSMKEQTPDVPEYPADSAGRVIAYKNN